VAAAVDAFFVANLKEHDRYGFSRPLKDRARTQAKAYLDQRIIDKRAELCADHLKLTEDVKAAPAKYVTGDCASAAVVTLMDAYMTKVANTFDENRRVLASLGDAHVNDLKLKLFGIAKGSTAGLEGTAGGYPLASAPKEVKFEWLKQEASKLGAEAHAVWGGAAQNPLVQRSLEFAREAARAKQERDSLKARYHTDGRLSPSCRLK
jgi:hypothetical protein